MLAWKARAETLVELPEVFVLRTRMFKALAATSVAAALGLVGLGHARAGQNVHILVFMENGVGSASQAQPFLDKLIEVAKKANGWDSADGKYVTKRSAAKEYISSSKPQYGILSLGAFLAMRNDNGLKVIGTAEVDTAGGRKYHIISKNAGDVAGCKGKTLASNHFGDKTFIDNVVADGAFKTGDFTLVETTRPVQTIKKVVSGDAECALIDNAQLDELGHLEGGSSIKTVWSSAKLPAPAVVAFSSAPDAERAKFKASLGSLCTGDGKSHCDKVGITSIREADESSYKSVIAKYGK